MTDSSYIHEATRETFQRLAIERSAEVPVLVDFWAAWCGPCRSLMPMLASLAEEFGGRFELVKVNTDEERELAGEFGIRSLPTVMVLREGRIVDQFMGAQPESAIRALLDRHLPRPSESALAHAATLRAAGDARDALSIVDEALAADPTDTRAAVLRAELLLDLERLDEFEQAVAALPADTRQDPAIEAARARAGFVRYAAGAAPLDTLRAAVDTDPADCRARVALAARLVLAGDHAAAMEELLEVVRRDRRFDEEAGRRMLLALFRVLGADSALARTGRARLASLLN